MRKDGFYKAVSIITVIVIWMVMRIFSYSEEWSNLHNLIQYKDTGMWYFTGSFIRDNLLKSLWYLASDPPVPQLIFGFLVKIFGWPYQLPIDSIFVSLMVLGIAFFIRYVLLFSGAGILVATLMAVLWVLNPSILAAEMEGWQRGFYEIITTLLFSLLFWFLIASQPASQPASGGGEKINAAFFAILVALLVMSRSSLSLFSPLAMIFYIVFYGGKHLLFMIFFGVQILWSLKNLYIYDSFNFETSSFSPVNIISGIARSDGLDIFKDFLKNDVRYFCVEQFVRQFDGVSPLVCYENQIKKDDMLREMLGIHGGSSVGSPYLMLAVSQDIKPAFLDFLFSNPDYLVRKIAGSYLLFWGDIGDGFVPMIEIGDSRVIELLTLVSSVVRYFNIFVIHVFSIPLFLFFCLKFIGSRGVGLKESAIFLFAVSCFLYYAFLTSIVEAGENNRFRIAVESLVWILPFLTISQIKKEFIV